jgi:uncharacterized protein
MRKTTTRIFLVVLAGVGVWYGWQAMFNRVTIQTVEEDGVQGKYFFDPGSRNRTVVVLLGGDEWCNFWGERFAENGHAALSLQYFGSEGLPAKMEEIPLEYFGNAFEWLTRQPEVETSNMLVMGSGRNAELALLLASMYPSRIKGAILPWLRLVVKYRVSLELG